MHTARLQELQTQVGDKREGSPRAEHSAVCRCAGPWKGTVEPVMSDSVHVLNREAQCFPARLGIRMPRGFYRAEGKSGGLARRARSKGTGSGPEAEVRGRG